MQLIISSGKFRWYEASIFVTAITLSSLRTWQADKLSALFSFYEAGQEQVMERGLSGLILNFHYYNNRLLLYPEITGRIRSMSTDDRFREHCRIIMLQTIRSRETEKLSKKLNEEILPRMAKLRPRIEEKLILKTSFQKTKMMKEP